MMKLTGYLLVTKFCTLNHKILEALLYCSCTTVRMWSCIISFRRNQIELGQNWHVRSGNVDCVSSGCDHVTIILRRPTSRYQTRYSDWSDHHQRTQLMPRSRSVDSATGEPLEPDCIPGSAGFWNSLKEDTVRFGQRWVGNGGEVCYSSPPLSIDFKIQCQRLSLLVASYAKPI